MDYKYKKPIYDPFIIFNPSKTFVKDVIKELKEEAYAKTKQIEDFGDREWPVPSWLAEEQSKLLSRIKQYEYRLSLYNKFKEWDGTESGRFSESDIERARAVPIEQFYDGTLRRTGRTLVGSCPFHQEKSASFTIYLHNNTYFCFGCNSGGDSIHFMELAKGIKFVEAVRLLINM